MNIQQKITTSIQVSVGAAIGCVLAIKLYKASKAYYLNHVNKGHTDEVIFEEESM